MQIKVVIMWSGVAAISSTEWGTLKLLVVDDNDLLREQMAKYLRRNHHDVIAVPNAEQALKTMDVESFEVCITDHKMTGMDGMDLVTTIEEKYPRTKVMLMTGSASIRVMVKALDRGAHQVFQKPFQMNQIIEALHTIEDDSQASKESGMVDQD